MVTFYPPKTQEEFIANAKAKHGDRYDYSSVVYIGSPTKIAIKCKEHGIFWQRASSHLEGRGCRTCSNQNRRAITTDIFISMAREIHGDKYNYSKTIFAGSKRKLIIICSFHGSFEQFPMNHLANHGCRECYNQFVNRYTTEKFITKAIALHGQAYDYSNVNYVGHKNAVQIICRTHGVFLQKPVNHLQGNGCPKCAKENALLVLARNRDGRHIPN